ncbi:hypothetical protein CYCD_10970 [Tenuifilaceae bacterium CYCD]|nr:hypothetical protein CYCD_10970 [Tenuifilaceae bacterium CYCD]
MKKLLFLALFSVSAFFLNAAPFKFLPYKVTQPNGEVIDCFVSGDEFYNWIHDKEGYTIIQNADGYYYYATQTDSKIASSSYRVNSVNPDKIGIKKWIKVSKQEYEKRKLRYQVPSSQKAIGSNKAPHTGTLNNIVIYIRFADDAEIATTRDSYDNIMNSTTGYSLKTYYNEVSYNNFTISSTHYPTCTSPSTSNASYKDSHQRNYFRPYNATTNPIGYNGDSEAAQREHQLLYDAVTWINANSPVDQSLNIDADADGYVDNVCFMIKGNCDGWSDLLWAHRWVLYTKEVYINSKRVYDYTFQPENQVAASVLCHEMFHALGAPDLYHYNENDFSPVGDWDIMESGEGHMGAYMKWKYADAKWITSIPEITSSGTYTLNPLTSSTNNCYKIGSPNSDKEFFILEYRKKEGTLESNIPGSGLIVYRINTDFEGNADFDNASVFDEVYIYRPNGTNLVNGYVSSAYFSSEASRTSINDATNPKCFLHDGMPGGLDISEVGTAGSTISFKVYISDIKSPTNFTASSVSENQIDLSWSLNTDGNDVVVAYASTGIIGSPAKGTTYAVGASIPNGGTVIYSGNATSLSHTSLTPGTNYTYCIWSKTSNNEYSPGVSVSTSTDCGTPALPITQGFNGTEISPCWTIVNVAQGTTQDESASITQVSVSTLPDVNPYEGTHMVKFNSAMCGAGNSMRLESPSFSSVGKTQVPISFSWHKDSQWPNYPDYMTLQWSLDGTTWNNGDTYQRYSTTIGWTQQTYNLPSEALGQENIKIGFLFTSAYGYNCYLDNVKITGVATSIGDVDADKVSVYPNPTDGNFTVKSTEGFKTLLLELHDISGRIVYSNSYHNSDNAAVNTSGLSRGIYLLKVSADGRVENIRVVIE